MNTASLLFVAALLAATSHAAPASYPGAEACKADVEKFCAGVKPGNGGIHQCLKRHESELSPACAKFRAAATDKIKIFMQACGADIRTHCDKVQPGGGRVVQCLKEHRSAVSAACQAQLTEAR